MPEFPINVPTPARMYDYSLGGKDNFPIDRAAVLTVCERYPAGLDATRENRLFLYRVVRFLARDAKIRQFIDLGSGLPTQANVHQVAQEFQPDARVVYVDHDPMVLTHGRALIDFSLPVAVLLLSVTHSIVDDAKVRRLLAAVRTGVVAGSYLGYSQLAGPSRRDIDEANAMVNTRLGMAWKNRTLDDVRELLRGLEPVQPGLVDVKTWRPDASQPPLAPVDEPLRDYIGAGADETRFYEFGGVLRIP